MICQIICFFIAANRTLLGVYILTVVLVTLIPYFYLYSHFDNLKGPATSHLISLALLMCPADTGLDQLLLAA